MRRLGRHVSLHAASAGGLTIERLDMTLPARDCTDTSVGCYASASVVGARFPGEASRRCAETTLRAAHSKTRARAASPFTTRGGCRRRVEGDRPYASLNWREKCAQSAKP